ncbi:MAG TPA: hypothetical protein VGM56_32720 [Byssovorax sp.]
MRLAELRQLGRFGGLDQLHAVHEVVRSIVRCAGGLAQFAEHQGRGRLRLAVAALLFDRRDGGSLEIHVVGFLSAGANAAVRGELAMHAHKGGPLELRLRKARQFEGVFELGRDRVGFVVAGRALVGVGRGVGVVVAVRLAPGRSERVAAELGTSRRRDRRERLDRRARALRRWKGSEGLARGTKRREVDTRHGRERGVATVGGELLGAPRVGRGEVGVRARELRCRHVAQAGEAGCLREQRGVRVRLRDDVLGLPVAAHDGGRQGEAHRVESRREVVDHGFRALGRRALQGAEGVRRDGLRDVASEQIVEGDRHVRFLFVGFGGPAGVQGRDVREEVREFGARRRGERRPRQLARGVLVHVGRGDDAADLYEARRRGVKPAHVAAREVGPQEVPRAPQVGAAALGVFRRRFARNRLVEPDRALGRKASQRDHRDVVRRRFQLAAADAAAARVDCEALDRLPERGAHERVTAFVAGGAADDVFGVLGHGVFQGSHIDASEWVKFDPATK